MKWTDGDLEFILRCYSIAKEHIAEKQMQSYADDMVAELSDYGFSMAEVAEELSEYDTYLANACEEFINEEDEDCGFEEEDW